MDVGRAGSLEFWPETFGIIVSGFDPPFSRLSCRCGSGKDQFFSPHHVFAFRAEHPYPNKVQCTHSWYITDLYSYHFSFVWPTRFCQTRYIIAQLGDFKSFPRLWGKVWTTLQWMSAKSFAFGRFIKQRVQKSVFFNCWNTFPCFDSRPLL